MRNDWRVEAPQLAIIAGLFAAAAILWNRVPDRLPVHFDLAGSVDRYGDKVEGLLVLPLTALAIYLLLRFLPALDPARANYPAFAGPYAALRVTFVVFMALVDAALLLPLVGVPLDMAIVMRLAIGGLFVVLGSVLGKIRPNWFVGIRTPWTLASKRSWVQTHRLGGWVFVVSGLVLMASCAFASPLASLVAFVVLGAGVLWTLVYSYLAYRGDPERFPAISARPE